MIEPNILDRAISFVSPAAGTRRMRSRVEGEMVSMVGAYNAGRFDRRQTMTWYTANGSADADTLFDIPTIRMRSRDAIRNQPLAAGAIHTVVQNAVGTGLALQPTPDIQVLGWTEEKSIEWSADVAHEFNLWAESPNCDITRTQDFYEAQRLVIRSMLESGDIFALLPMRPVAGSPYKTRFQLIEADRVATPGGADGFAAVIVSVDGTKTLTGNKVYGGVEVDAYGAPVAYCVLKQHPGAVGVGAVNLLDYDRVPAFGTASNRRNVIHVFDRLRPDQNRGVPYLAPVLEMLKQLDRYKDAELMAAEITAKFTTFIKSDTGDGAFLQSQSPAPPAGPTDIELGAGRIIGLAPGEDVTFADPTRPNPEFDPFVMAMLRQVGVALELPFEILIKHFTSSYSAARAAMLEAWKFYRNRRAFVASRFCQPFFEAWMDEAVAMGRITAPGYFSNPTLRRAYVRAEWVGDAPGQIDPQKEVGAAKERVDLGISTLQIEAMELTGRNWADMHQQRVREHELRVDGGLEPAIANTTATELVPATLPGEDDTETPPAPAKKGGTQ